MRRAGYSRPGAEQQLQHQNTKTIDSDAVQAIGLTGDQTIAIRAVFFAVASRATAAPGAWRVKTHINGFLLYQMSRRARDLEMLATVRRVLTTFSLMVDDIDSFTEAGFAFRGRRRRKRPGGWRRSKDFSRPLLRTQTGILRKCRPVMCGVTLSQTVTRKPDNSSSRTVKTKMARVG